MKKKKRETVPNASSGQNGGLLKNINSPRDLKKIEQSKLDELAEEIRHELIADVSQTGGHLASNLGVVELTIALHRVFDSPKDKIIWDVGHQCYVHKLLTGRRENFSTLRTEGGISGFTRPDESEHDVFYSGHSSTALSAAYGIAAANKISGNNDYTVAVIGDGAFTGGMVYEAMNNAGSSGTKLIVVFNDNKMSISENVGALPKYFAVVRSNPRYFKLKARTEKVIVHIPLVGEKLANAIFKVKTTVKNLIYNSTMFEDFGFRYMGPIDGHNIKQLCDALEGAKAAACPVFLHVNTIKGKGYEYAEKSPSLFHGISKFDINSGEPLSGGADYSKIFGDYLCEAAEKDRRICAVTAAMSIGTGLEKFSKKYPERFFDVGIAEQHAVTFCSGLSKAGMLPVFAVYSSFLQRAYDQLVHDGALQRQKLVIAIDRAGFVGQDGETHHGLLDVPFLNTIPDVTVYSPSSYAELRNSFYKAFYYDAGLVAVRYHRGPEIPLPSDFKTSYSSFDYYGDENAKFCVCSYGREFAFCADAVNSLRKKGILVACLKLNRIKPIDDDAVKMLLSKEYVFFFEEGEKSGGVGEILLERLNGYGYTGGYKITAVDDRFVMHALVSDQLKHFSLDTDGIIRVITDQTEKLTGE